MAANLPDFEDLPQLEEEYLILIALSSYQIKTATSYCAEHLIDGLYIIELYRDNELDDISDYNIEVNQESFLLKGRIQSRRTRAKQYYTYVLINISIEGRNAFRHYYVFNRSSHSCGVCSRHFHFMVLMLGSASGGFHTASCTPR